MRQHDVWVFELSTLGPLREFLQARPELELEETNDCFQKHELWTQSIEGRMSALLWKWLTAWFETPSPDDVLEGLNTDHVELGNRIFPIAREIVEKFDTLGLPVICMTGIQCLNATDVAIGMLRQNHCPG
jgi:hypothetical protein